jgi:hypothetical protein
MLVIFVRALMITHLRLRGLSHQTQLFPLTVSVVKLCYSSVLGFLTKNQRSPRIASEPT